MADKTVITTAPPPPSEVKIRTMHSDIDSMMKSGGGAPSFQNVAVLGLSMEKNFKPAAVARTAMPAAVSAPAQPASAAVATPVHVPAMTSSTFSPPAQNSPMTAGPAIGPLPTEQAASSEAGSNMLPIIIVIIVAVIAIAVVGYFAYTIFK